MTIKGVFVMKKQIIKISALFTTAVLLLCAVSCERNNDDINDSQESTSSSDDNNTTNKKQEITVGMITFNSLLSPAITEFNRTNKQYELKIIDYSKLVEEDDDDYSKALNALKLDLTTGNSPDIVSAYSGDMRTLIETGAFTDIYKLMDEYDGVKKVDFLPNIIKGFEINGEIPAISYGFSIKTANAKSKFVGADAENWTVQQAINTYNSMPDNMDFLYQSSSNYDLANFIMKKAARNCIDFQNYTCDFSKPEFSSLLNFLSTASYNVKVSNSDFSQMSDDEISMYFNELNMAIINDKALVNEFSISGFNDTLGWNICSYFGGEDVTYVGYPTNDGIGTVTEASFMFGILENSDNKQGSWEFINSLFSDSFLKEKNAVNFCLPVITNVLEDAAFNTSEFEVGSIRSQLSLPNNYEETIIISDEAIQKAYDYIINVDFEPYYDHTIDNIIKEEYAAALAGEKTGEAVADILQSRLSIYLSEKK